MVVAFGRQMMMMIITVITITFFGTGKAGIHQSNDNICEHQKEHKQGKRGYADNISFLITIMQYATKL